MPLFFGKKSPYANSRISKLPRLNNLLMFASKLKTKELEFASDLVSEPNDETLTAKHQGLKLLNNALETIISDFNEDKLSVSDLLQHLNVTLTKNLSTYRDHYRVFRSPTKQLVGKVTKGAAIGMTAVVTSFIASPIVTGVVAYYGGNTVNRATKDAVGFDGSHTATMQLIIQLQSELKRLNAIEFKRDPATDAKLAEALEQSHLSMS